MSSATPTAEDILAARGLRLMLGLEHLDGEAGDEAMATSDEINKGIAAIRAATGGEPIRDAMVFVLDAKPDLNIPEGYILRLERSDDGLWHEVPKTVDDGLRWNNSAFAFTPDGEKS